MDEQPKTADYSQPFYQYDGEGNVVGGYGTTVPTLTPGAPEHSMFLDSEFLKSDPNIAALHKTIDDDFTAASKPDTSAQGYKLPPPAITLQFSDSAEAKRALTVAKLETEHDAEHVLHYIGDDIRGMINEVRDQGNFDWRASKDMTDEEIVALAEARGVDPVAIQYLKNSKQNPVSNYGIDIMSAVRRRMFRYDERYQSGKTVAADIQNQLFALPDGPIKAQAMRNYSYYRAFSEDSMVPQFAHALGHLVASVGEAVAVDLPFGAVQAIAGTADESLSPKYIANKELRSKAVAVVERAERLARSGLYKDIAKGGIARGDSAKTIEKAGEFVRNPEVQQVMLDLQALNDDGAFVPASRFSRLYSFFDGGVKATQEFYRMFAASSDPNSLFFNLEAGMSEKGGLMYSIAATAQGTKRYQLARDDEVLRMSHQLESNYNHANSNTDRGGIERMYMSMADAASDPATKTYWLEAAKAAGELTNLGVTDRAQYVLDPSVIAGGAVAKAVGSMVKTTAKVAFIDAALATKASSLGDEILTAVRATEKGAEVLEPAVKALQDRLKLMGVVVSDNEAIAIALSNNAQSWEVRAALGGVTSEAATIRQTIGNLSAGNKTLRTNVQNFLSEAKTAAGKAPKPKAGIARPIGGAVAGGVGVAGEVTGTFLDKLGTLLLGATPEGIPRLSLEAAKAIKLGRATGYTGLGGAIALGYGISEGGVEGVVSGIGQFAKGAATVAAFGVGAKIVAPTISKYSKLIKNVSTEIASGERKGVSVFMASADRLDESAAVLKKTDPKKALEMMKDAQVLRNLNKTGYEEALTQTLVVGVQGASGASAGAVLAWGNSRDSMSAGAGMGFGGALIAGAASKLGAMLPSGVQASREMGVMATSLYYINRASPEQRANFFEMFNREVGIDANGRFQNKDKAMRVLDAYNLMNGALGQAGWELANPGAMQGATVATRHANIDLDALKTVAGQMYPNDPAMAAAYAERLVQRVNTQNNQFATIAAANARLERNTKASEANLRTIESVKEGIAKAEAAGLDKRAAELKSDLSSREAKQEVYAKERAMLEQTRDLEKSRLVDKESITKEADRQKLEGDERTKFIEAETLRQTALLDPIRPGELRTGTAGNQIRQIADGFYINDGNGKVMVDFTRADALTMIHEGFEAILRDDSLKAVMPELVNFFYADPSSPSSTKRLLSDQNRQRFFDLYTSDLTPENATQYKKDLASAEKLFKETGDYSALLPFVQEASAWWLAVLHDAYPPGYANVLGAAPTSGYQGRIFGRLFEAEKSGKFSRRPGELMKALMETGSKTEISGVLASEWEAFMNPEYGWLGEKSRKLIRSRLESNGMIFEDASDGTVRGYFRQNGETINNPIMGDLYRVISRNQSGGKRSAGIDIISNPRVPEGVKIEWIRQNGLDHMLTDPSPSGEPVRIKTPEEQVDTNIRITNSVRDTLSGVPTDQRGMQTTPDKDGNVIFHGVPSAAEITAVKNNPDLPPVVRDNLVTAMEGLLNGKANSVMRAQYVNVRTKQKQVGTEARLVVPDETGGPVVSEKEFVPLGISFAHSQFLPGGAKVPGGGTIPTARLLVFDIGAAKGNLNTVRNKGMFDKSGLPMKDIDGSDMTPARFRELFPTDGDFWNAANVYLTHLQAAGKIDATSNRPVMPAGYEPSSVKLASLMGDPTNTKLGESMRNAIRFTLGIDARKDMVLLNPAGYGKVIRDINQTISNLRIDGLGKATRTGETFTIDNNTIGWSQANMAPSTWRALNQEGLNALRATDGWETKQAFGHPNNNFRIVEDSRTVDGSTEKRVRIYDAATGNLIDHTATDVKSAREFVRDKMATDSANAEVANAVAEFARTEAARYPIVAETRTGKKVNPEMTNTIGRMAPIGGGPNGLTLEPGYAYRIVNANEVRSIFAEGVMITDPALEGQAPRSRGQTLKKMFSEFNPDKPGAGYQPGSIVVRVRRENVPTDTKGVPVRDADVEVMQFNGKEWVAKTTAEFLGEKVEPGLAVKEQQAYNKKKSEAIAAAARRVIKEREIKFVKNENERVDVQRKWEEEAARLAASERAAEVAAATKAERERVAAETAAETRRRQIENDMGKQFADKANELSAAERFYFGDKIKLNNAITVIDKTPKGLVDLERTLSLTPQQLGVEVKKVDIVQPLPLPIYRKALVFDKRPLSKAPMDVMNARAGMRDIAEATTLQGVKGAMQEANNYVLSNALGQVIVSEMRARQGTNPYRVFTVYAAGTKTKLLETQSFQEALQRSLSDAYRAEAKARAVKVPTQAEVGMALEVAGRATKGKTFAPNIIQRYR
jgi:hypothetical protein